MAKDFEKMMEESGYRDFINKYNDPAYVKKAQKWAGEQVKTYNTFACGGKVKSKKTK